MEQLTKEQRHNIYKEALALLLEAKSEGNSEFLCTAIRDAMFKNKLCVRTMDCRLIFPMGFSQELESKKPKDAFYAWWPGDRYQERIEVLTQCIEETKP